MWQAQGKSMEVPVISRSVSMLLPRGKRDAGVRQQPAFICGKPIPDRFRVQASCMLGTVIVLCLLSAVEPALALTHRCTDDKTGVKPKLTVRSLVLVSPPITAAI